MELQRNQAFTIRIQFNATLSPRIKPWVANQNAILTEGEQIITLCQMQQTHRSDVA